MWNDKKIGRFVKLCYFFFFFSVMIKVMKKALLLKPDIQQNQKFNGSKETSLKNFVYESIGSDTLLL